MDVGAVAVSRCLRQAAFIVLMAIAARLLYKDLLGIWALIYIVIQFGVLLSDSGISTYVIRQKRLTASRYGTAFYLSTGLALLISGIVALVGLLIASLFGYGQYAWQFCAAALAITPLTVNGLLQARLRS